MSYLICTTIFGFHSQCKLLRAFLVPSKAQLPSAQPAAQSFRTTRSSRGQVTNLPMQVKASLEFNESAFWESQAGLWASPCVKWHDVFTSSNENRNWSPKISWKYKSLPSNRPQLQISTSNPSFQKYSYPTQVLISIRDDSTYGVLKSQTRKGSLISSFYSWGKWGPERGGDELKMTQRVTEEGCQHPLIAWENIAFPETSGKYPQQFSALSTQPQAGFPARFTRSSPGIPPCPSTFLPFKTSAWSPPPTSLKSHPWLGGGSCL